MYIREPLVCITKLNSAHVMERSKWTNKYTDILIHTLLKSSLLWNVPVAHIYLFYCNANSTVDLRVNSGHANSCAAFMLLPQSLLLFTCTPLVWSLKSTRPCHVCYHCNRKALRNSPVSVHTQRHHIKPREMGQRAQKINIFVTVRYLWTILQENKPDNNGEIVISSYICLFFVDPCISCTFHIFNTHWDAYSCAFQTYRGHRHLAYGTTQEIFMYKYKSNLFFFFEIWNFQFNSFTIIFSYYSFSWSPLIHFVCHTRAQYNSYKIL